MKKQLSIIIPNYNTKDLLKNCLNSIIENTNGVDYEIIVVDNASMDGSVFMLKNDFPQVRIVENVENLGFAKANNRGIRIAQAENILLLNSDTIIVGNCLLKVFKFAKENENIGIIGCKVLNSDKTLQYSCFHKPNFLSEVVFFTKNIIKDFWDPVSYYKYLKYWNHSSRKQIDCIAGCFLWVKKAVFDKVGLLDENIFMYYEDSEFCNRVKLMSRQKIYYYPHAEIIHLKGKSRNDSDFNTLKHCYKSAKYYFNKCYGERTERFFNICCKAIWQLELSFLSVFKFNKKFNEKFFMLKELYNL